MDTQTQTQTTPAPLNERARILAALERWIEQRGGLEFGNYGDVKAFRAEQRRITRQRDDARALLSAVAWRTSIDAAELRRAFNSAFSGRLSIVDKLNGEIGLDYCTGQYFPTEYRAAACAGLAEALWNHVRDNMPTPQLTHNSKTGLTVERYNGKRAGDWLRSHFKKQFGARMQRTWFD
jgi:hypothetical protein